MMQSKRVFAALFLVLFLTLSTENGSRGVEGRTCETPSVKFKGICVSSRNCGSVCESEGFPSGSCEGARRRCMCTRPCV